MRKALMYLLALTLAAALPAAAQTMGADAPCGVKAASTGEPGCCPSATSANDCQATDCAGWSSALLIALSPVGPAPWIADSPESLPARFVAPLARAPDTAPPKPVA
jgi:hypothetical protein